MTASSNSTRAARTSDLVLWRRRVLASGDLSAAEKVVALALHEHMDWDGANVGGNCWVSIDRLADETSLDRRTIARSVKSLIKWTFVSRGCRRCGPDPDEGPDARKCAGGAGHVNTFWAVLPVDPDTRQQGQDSPDRQGQDSPDTEGQGQDAPASRGRNAHKQGQDAPGPTQYLPNDLSKNVVVSGLEDEPGLTEDTDRICRALLEARRFTVDGDLRRLIADAVGDSGWPVDDLAQFLVDQTSRPGIRSLGGYVRKLLEELPPEPPPTRPTSSTDDNPFTAPTCRTCRDTKVTASPGAGATVVPCPDCAEAAGAA